MSRASNKTARAYRMLGVVSSCECSLCKHFLDIARPTARDLYLHSELHLVARRVAPCSCPTRGARMPQARIFVLPRSAFRSLHFCAEGSWLRSGERWRVQLRNVNNWWTFADNRMLRNRQQPDYLRDVPTWTLGPQMSHLNCGLGRRGTQRCRIDSSWSLIPSLFPVSHAKRNRVRRRSGRRSGQCADWCRQCT